MLRIHEGGNKVKKVDNHLTSNSNKKKKKKKRNQGNGYDENLRLSGTMRGTEHKQVGRGRGRGRGTGSAPNLGEC